MSEEFAKRVARRALLQSEIAKLDAEIKAEDAKVDISRLKAQHEGKFYQSNSMGSWPIYLHCLEIVSSKQARVLYFESTWQGKYGFVPDMTVDIKVLEAEIPRAEFDAALAEFAGQFETFKNQLSPQGGGE